MAHHKSAKKAARQTIKITANRRSRKSRIRNYTRKVEEAVTSGNKELAQQLFVQAQSEIMRGVTKGILKLNTASRKVSRLNSKIKNLG